MRNIDHVYDAVFREVVHGLSTDEWLWDQVLNRDTGKVVSAFDLILDLKPIQRLNEFNSAAKSKLRTGYLLGHIFGQFQRVGNGEILPKLTLYSSHDATLSSLLYSLNASNELLVPYAAAITFELYVDGLHMPSYYVKTLYRNETANDEAYSLQLCKEGSDMCRLDQFSKVFEKSMFKSVEDQRKKCLHEDKDLN